MASFFLWYLLITLLGWLTFPLAYRLFPALADRGYAFARAFGLLLWGFLFWILACLGVVNNDLPGLLLALIVLAGVSWSGLARKEGWNGLRDWLKARRRFIITTEIAFFLAFCAWTFVRASNPEITTAGGEKTMELAFINSILRSPTFPPQDPWLSGYAISYYYFGYVMTAMLAKVTATAGPVAHNLMLALVFALSIIGAYGILYDLLAIWRRGRPLASEREPAIGLPFLGPLFLLFVSNFAGFLEVLHRRGLFWKWNTDGTASSSFWSWVGIKSLTSPPTTPLGWVPTRYLWWWQDSRVIQDYDLNGTWHEIIDEFPAFSYLLGDLHPHVLAMPFGLLAIGVALNLFLGGWKGETDLGFYRLPVKPAGLFFGALVTGGLAFLNTWDILLGFGLMVGAFTLAQAGESGWSWKRLGDVFRLGVPLGLLSILLYLPFYTGFSSQAGGILPNLETPTKGVQLWVMLGPLFLPILAYLVYLWRAEKRPMRWKTGLGLTFALVFLLWAFSWALGLLVILKMPEFASTYLAGEGFSGVPGYFKAAGGRRLQYIGSLLTLMAILVPAVAILAKRINRPRSEEKITPPQKDVSSYFVTFLILVGALLVLAPEFIYLRDLFGNRMNTIFKFYYQAWMLWSLAASFGAAVMLQNLRKAWAVVYRICLAGVLIAALAFPVFSLSAKTNNFQWPEFQARLEQARTSGAASPMLLAAKVWTLDGAQLFHQQYPDDAAAADWLASAPAGVIVEAVGGQYTDFARFSVYSGQAAVVGWAGHEDQWRGTFQEQRTREADVKELYETRDWTLAQSVLEKYGVRYVMVGTLETLTYHVEALKFQQHLTTVFQSGDVTVYEVR
jgi:YYY domain-containing protein